MRALILIVVVGIGGAAAIDIATVPNAWTIAGEACTLQQNERWTFAQSSLGVVGFDPVGHDIVGYAAKKFRKANWYPITGEKEIICGELTRFGWYNGLGNENDLNNHIVPMEPYKLKFEQAKEHMKDSRETMDCKGQNDCFEAEITLPRAMFQNRLFPKPGKTPNLSSAEGESPAEGLPVCTYGPWVAEELHGMRVEIHPSELIWWRSPDRASLFVMVGNDDSNRFDTPGHFARKGYNSPGRWQPWNATPRRAFFEIAVEIAPGQPANYRFEALDELNLNLIGNGDGGPLHRIEFAAQSLLTIDEGGLHPALAVKVTDVCQSASVVRAIVEVQAAVGVNTNGMEGHLAFAFTTHQTIMAARPSASFSLTYVPESVRRAGTLMVADFNVVVDGTGNAPKSGIASARRLTMSGPEGLEMQRTARPDSIVLTRVPLGEAALEIVLTTGDTLSSPLPSIQLVPNVTVQVQRGSQLVEAPGVIQSLFMVSGLPGQMVASIDPPVGFSTRWEVIVAPAYAPVVDGRARPGDDNPIAGELNDAIAAGNVERLQRALGTANMEITSRDVVTEQFIEGRTQRANPIRWRAERDSPIRTGFIFEPNPEQVTRTRLRYVIRDPFGSTVQDSALVWSHGFITPDSLASGATFPAWRSFLDPGDGPGTLRVPARPTVKSQAASVRQQTAMLLSVLAEDGWLFPDEMARIVRLSSRLRNQ